MTDMQRPQTQHETETEVIPPVRSGDGIASTRELPVVEDGPTVVTPRPAPPTAVPARAGRLLVLAVLVALAVVAAVAGIATLGGRGSDSSGSSQAAAGKLSSTITSLDPSGGSGFRRDGAAWRTQTYVSPDFGGLKDGVGLLLDLGASRTVSRVTFAVAGGPIAVELRAGDSASGSASGFQRVAADPSASGSTTLTVKGGGEHRYWLLWVTELGAADGGYRAVIQAPTALGPRS